MKLFIVLLAALVSTISAAKYSESRRCVRFLGLTCPTEKDPYCGSDGKTYDNGCLFQQARCRLEGMLGFQWQGTCEGGRPTTTTLSPCSSRYVCSDISHPLCASDGRTYLNYCYFVKAQCKTPQLTRKFYGRCDDGPPTTTTHQPANICDAAFKCPPEKSPLCGTNGKTYENYCEFRKQVTCMNITGVTIESSGACVPKTTESPESICQRKQTRCLILLKLPAYAPVYGRPVCGSNKVFYNNYCEFDKANCKDPSITITFPTECPTPASTFKPTTAQPPLTASPKTSVPVSTDAPATPPPKTPVPGTTKTLATVIPTNPSMTSTNAPTTAPPKTPISGTVRPPLTPAPKIPVHVL